MGNIDRFRCRRSPVRSIARLAFLLAIVVASPLRAQHRLARVALVGDGLIERAQHFGHVETVLSSRLPGETLSFRNLGWSGDTVHGEARDHYTNPPTPFEHLIEQVRTVHPTAIVFGYGGNLAYTENSTDAFVEGYHTLLDSLVVTGVRCVLLSPIPHDARTSPNPDAAHLNAQLDAVRGAVAQVARDRGCTFVDLFTSMKSAMRDSATPLTVNGIHLTSDGYRSIAAIVESTLLGSARESDISVDLDDGRTAFSWRPSALPADSERGRVLRLAGLRRGTYALYSSGTLVATATSSEWSDGVRVVDPGERDQVDALRRRVVEKNKLYFRKYRPHNETYLVGFRRNEQGQNAGELDLLDPLIDAYENEIGRLAVPRLLRFTLKRQ